MSRVPMLANDLANEIATNLAIYTVFTLKYPDATRHPSPNSTESTGRTLYR